VERKELRQKRSDQIDRSFKDLEILFRAYLSYLSPFQSYGGLKKLKRSMLLRLIVLLEGEIVS